jgi:hypothetical protein
VDAAGRQALIEELCSFAGRGPGTDAERRAANMLVGRLREMGRAAEPEPAYVHPSYALVHLLHALIAIVGSIVGVSLPALGFALVLFAATSAYLDLNTRLYLVRSLLFRRASQNVVSPGNNPGGPLRLLLTAHYDAARSGYVFGERGIRVARRLSPRWRVLLGPFRVLFWGGIAPLVPILGARMAGIDAGWLSVVQLLPTVLLVVAAFLLIDIALSKIVPGAYDNASGVAAVLSVAERLRDEPTPNLDVWVVLPGSEECLAEGMRSYLRAHRRDLDRERTVIVNIDSVSYGSVHYETSEGPVISTAMDSELIELCEALGVTLGAAPLRSPLLTDALPARIRKLRAISIVGASDGLPPPWYHTHDDVPGRVDTSSLTAATDFVVGLARLLDREAGRRAPADTGRPARGVAA